MTELDPQAAPVGFEASDLQWLEAPTRDERREWDLAYLVVGDEGPLERGVSVHLHRAGAPATEGWVREEVVIDCGEQTDETDDPEAVAVFDGWIYVVGSHFGSKRGPLKAKRQWIARIPEAALCNAVCDGSPSVAAQVQVDKFRLHRVINDALKGCGFELTPRDERITAAFITDAKAEGKSWADRLEADDWPLNVEASAFRPNGDLMLGLRFPTCADGSPIAVELNGVVDAFENAAEPGVVAVWRLAGPGTVSAPVGFRAMVTRGHDEFDCILGSLDADDKESLIIECHPQGALAVSQHWRFQLPSHADGGVVEALPGQRFDGVRDVEGLAHAPAGDLAYVRDDPQRTEIRFFKPT